MDNQRLFRLTSQSNDGVFSTLFNEDIAIEPGSEIALQSASFDRQSLVVNIDAKNREVNFGLLVDPAKQWKANMEEGEYSQLQDGESLLTSTAKQMNLVLDMGKTTNLVTSNGFPYSIDRGSQWQMGLDKDGKTSIRAKTNGPCLISDDFWVTSSDASKTTTVFASTGTNAAPSITVGVGADFISRTGGGGTTNYNESYVYGKVPMVKGTGCVRTRIGEWTQTGAGLCATIGLVSDYSKLTSGTIADADILYGWQLAGNNVNYFYKDGGGAATWTDSGVGPDEVSADTNADNSNDVLEIVIGGSGPIYADGKKQVELTVHTDLAGATTPGTNYLLYPDAGTDLYYFISFARPIELDMVEVDLDPYKFTQDYFGALYRPSESLLPGVVRSAAVGNIDIPSTDRRGNFAFPSNEIGAFYGFLPGRPENIVPTSITQSEDYTFVSTLRPEFSVTAKNFLVLFDELPLNSYDSYSRFDVNARNANSGGSRRNLLATVPVKEDQLAGTSVTQVAFEPNTLDYISLRNNSTFLTRTLGCRILTSTYQPIQIDGMASMTLLIKEHGSGSCH